MIIKLHVYPIPLFSILIALVTICECNVTPLDPSTLKLVMADKMPSIFLLMNTNYVSQTSTNKQSSKRQVKSNTLFQFHKAAQLFYQKYPQKIPIENMNKAKQQKSAKEDISNALLFIVSDTNDGLYTYERTALYLGVLPEQQFCIILLNHRHLKYKYQGQFPASAQQIVDFIDKYYNNQAPIFYKSEPIPKKNPQRASIKLVGQNFWSTIKDSQQQFFVLFHKSFDYKSRVVKMQFQMAAEALKNNTNIIFAKINVDSNQVVYEQQGKIGELVQKQFNQNDAPAIYFWHQNKKQKYIEYPIFKDYEISYDYMLKWLKQHTAYPWIRSQKPPQFIEEDL